MRGDVLSMEGLGGTAVSQLGNGTPATLHVLLILLSV